MNPQATANPQPVAPVAPPASGGITAASPQTPTAVNLPAVPQYNPQASMDAIRNYYQIPQSANMATNQAQVGAATQGQQYQAGRAMQQYQAGVLSKKLDPSQYHAIADPNGGPTAILDSQGNRVSVGQYAQLTGENPTTILKNSQNKDEQQFTSDYQNFEQYMQAKLSPNNKEAQAVAQTFEASNPGLVNLTPAQATQAFMQQYGQYFGGQGGQQTGMNFQPAYNPSTAQYLFERQLLANQGASGLTGSSGSSNPYGVDLSGLFPPSGAPASQ